MTWPVDSAVKAALLVGVGLAQCLLMRRRSAASRHTLLAAVVVTSLAMPLFGLVTPSWNINIGPPALAPSPAPWGFPASAVVVEPPPFPSGAASPGSAIQTASVPARISPMLMAWVWLLGTGFSVIVLLAGLARLRVIARTAGRIDDGPLRGLTNEIARELHLAAPIRLLSTSHPGLLVTWGWRRPTVLLPAKATTWSDERLRVVLRHELAHIQRGDWAIQMLAEILCALYWFNPLVWLACRSLRQESERACDDSVIGGGMTGSDYATQLVDLARTLKADAQGWIPAEAMARPSNLEGRISAMLNDRIDRSPMKRSTRLAALAGALLLAVPIAAAQNSFSTFSGTVLDATNRTLPGASLLITNTRNQTIYGVTTDPAGHFQLVGLPDGAYAVEIHLTGFATTKETITVAGRNLDRTYSMKVGSLEESLTINGARGASTATAPSPDQLEERRLRAEARQEKALSSCNASALATTGGQILAPIPLTHVMPVYSEAAKNAGVQGVVIMQAFIGPDGNVREVKILRSVDPNLDSAAADAVSQWQYSPTLLNCIPIEVQMTVTANFAIRP